MQHIGSFANLIITYPVNTRGSTDNFKTNCAAIEQATDHEDVIKLLKRMKERFKAKTGGTYLPYAWAILAICQPEVAVPEKAQRGVQLARQDAGLDAREEQEPLPAVKTGFSLMSTAKASPRAPAQPRPDDATLDHEAHTQAHNRSRRRKKKGSNTPPTAPKKRRLSKTETCVVEGRDESKLNASINGTYRRVLGGDHAERPSFEKVGAEGKSRFLLFSSKKAHWLISNVADDSRKGFAFLPTPAGSKALPSELSDVRWEVFDGKEEGYRQDPQVKCRALCENSKVPKSARKSVEAQTLELDLTKFMEGARLVQYTKAALDWCDKMGAASLDDVIDNAEELSEALKLKPLERKRLVKAGSSRAHADGDKNDGDKSHDEGNDSSRESSASSSSSSSSGRAPDHWDAASSTMAPSSKIIDLESTPQSVLGSATPIDARRARVCAKMMVRSGLRCSCHFLHLRDCSAHSRTAATESSVQVAGVVVDVLPS